MFTPELLHGGLGYSDLGLFLNRFILGLFFVIYRFRWIYDPSDKECSWFSPRRRYRLMNRLCTCGYTDNAVLAGTVAMVEILAGLALMAGFLTIPAAGGIIAVMIFANCCTPKEEIPLMNPVDKIDWVACYLRLVEPLYLFMALLVVLMGPGRWSIDYALYHMVLR